MPTAANTRCSAKCTPSIIKATNASLLRSRRISSARRRRVPTTNRSLTALLPAPRTSNSLGRASNERACCAARPLAPPPHLGQTSTPDSTHKRAYVGVQTNIDLVRRSNGPGNIQIASVKLRKYDARISVTKFASRVRCFCLPEQKSVRCEIAVVMRFCREYQGSAIPQRRNDQFCGIRYGWVSGLTRMHDGQAQDFVPLSVGEGISTPRLRGTFNDVTSFRAFTEQPGSLLPSTSAN